MDAWQTMRIKTTVEMRYKLPDYIIVTRRKLHYYSAFSVPIMRFPCPFLSLSRSFAHFFASVCVRACNECQTNLMGGWKFLMQWNSKRNATGLTPKFWNTRLFSSSINFGKWAFIWVFHHKTPKNSAIPFFYNNNNSLCCRSALENRHV